ncbi:MAG TPA: ABC1 kinase family protein [Candidatus Avalokitesvara rifleensis]|uniref:ABC1 kinase family protein n=1 Tax=Candidatus Avalokitesvara rifleensis TaxID=3367620 RepID=UPI002713547B|nr:AarF/UbiB family protein [Candidatus Brocadiales bacterium]
MRLRDITRTPRRLQRLSHILQVLVRHGFGHMVSGLRLGEHLPIGKRFIEKRIAFEETPLAARIVLVLQELGPAYVKLGQMLSTRPDILPSEFIQELRKLQKDVKSFDPKLAKTIIEKELKKPVKELFSTFQDDPIACGSIAQVHAATLPDDAEVVVKVKRPDIEQIIRDDMDLLTLIAERAEGIEELKPFRPVMLVGEFNRVIQNELDFITEASNTAKFYNLYRDKENVRIPKLYWDLTTSSVLTMQRFKDISLCDMKTIEEKGVNTRRLAAELLTSFVEQYFKAGIFHADPHPGNLMVSELGTISMMDFGMVGYVTEDLRSQLTTALFALLRKDMDLYVEIFMDIGAIPSYNSKNIDALKASLLETLEKYRGIPLERIDLRNAFHDLMRVSREYALVLPRDFVLLGKSFVTVTGMARQLDPKLDLQKMITPVAKDLLRERLSPEHIRRMAGDASWHLTNLLAQGPKEMRQIIRKLLAGKIEVSLRHVELEYFAYELDRSSNRLALSIILAATVIASSLVMMAKIGPMVMDNIPLFGILGYFFSTVMGIWLAIGILRSGRL